MTREAGKESHRLAGRGLLEMPEPVQAGWMKKRGQTNSSWKRRYVALIDPPDEMGLGAALYYFVSEQSMRRLIDLGEQTQKGQLFLEHVIKVSANTDKCDRDFPTRP